ncbi:thioredoxin domain-containing protein [Stappia sp. GBMRC 2046]|uniref:Thioredoxin domain-containing protein n=1 Tax=Stappia sediminis TaxID=2692190 RepID=A0A7X3LVW1_9HYPH|nr:DsbA family protein [Stappia sediminis]MXN66084.1 thioredoxin domain-containing protein [Stappia sediminis]
MTLNRRQFLDRSARVMLAAGLTLSAVPALAESVDVEALMQAGPLPEMALGDENAPVTIVEYASMTCGHCANFHKNTYPHLKSEYIEKGKVRFLFREFPLDPVATAAFMLARCAPEDKYFDVVDTMFAEQRKWAFTNDPYNSLLNFAKQIGFTQENFESCLQNQELLDAINNIKNRASSEFGVSSTPTFFVNGEKVNGAITVEQLDEELAKHL